MFSPFVCVLVLVINETCLCYYDIGKYAHTHTLIYFAFSFFNVFYCVFLQSPCTYLVCVISGYFLRLSNKRKEKKRRLKCVMKMWEDVRKKCRQLIEQWHDKKYLRAYLNWIAKQFCWCLVIYFDLNLPLHTFIPFSYNL